MNIKILLLAGIIVAIILLALFGSGFKQAAIKGIAEEVPEYDCDEEGFCTSCMVEGVSCSCGQHTCDCGNNTIDKKECTLSSLL